MGPTPGNITENGMAHITRVSRSSVSNYFIVLGSSFTTETNYKVAADPPSSMVHWLAVSTGLPKQVLPQQSRLLLQVNFRLHLQAPLLSVIQCSWQIRLALHFFHYCIHSGLELNVPSKTPLIYF